MDIFHRAGKALERYSRGSFVSSKGRDQKSGPHPAEPNSRGSPTQEFTVSSTASPGSSNGPGGGQQHSPGMSNSKLLAKRRSKDNLVKQPNVHPLLASEFSTDVTPPGTPTGRASSSKLSVHTPSPSNPRGGGSFAGASSSVGSHGGAGGGPANTSSLGRSPNGDVLQDSILNTSPPHATRPLGSSDNMAALATTCPTAHDVNVKELLSKEDIDLPALRKMCWGGAPVETRAECWNYLSGYFPIQRSRMDIVKRKRAEYHKYVATHYSHIPWNEIMNDGTSKENNNNSASNSGNGSGVSGGNPLASTADDPNPRSNMTPPLPSASTEPPTSTTSTTLSSSVNNRRAAGVSPPVQLSASEPASASSTLLLGVGQEELGIMKQIRKDVPRSSNGIYLLQCQTVQSMLERILFIWAIQHPACGYVQGMNDLILPFLLVMFAAKLCTGKRVSQLTKWKITDEELLKKVPEEELKMIEADIFWNASRLLSSIQENYTYNQRGTHAMVKKLQDTLCVVDPEFCKHLSRLGIAFSEFAFKWMNCLLLRELSPLQSIRLWDTYLSEEEGSFSNLHVYVCASLIQRLRHLFLESDDFGYVMHLLQNPPTSGLTDRDIGELTSQAFLMQQLYERSTGHLQSHAHLMQS